jgi:hypothetical protein
LLGRIAELVEVTAKGTADLLFDQLRHDSICSGLPARGENEKLRRKRLDFVFMFDNYRTINQTLRDQEKYR